jgi:nucleoid-associated protein YgaU
LKINGLLKSCVRVTFGPRILPEQNLTRVYIGVPYYFSRADRIKLGLLTPTIKEKIMGLLSFMKTAGQKLFGTGEAHAAAVADPSPANLDAANAAAAQAIEAYIASMNLNAAGLSIAVDASQGAVTVMGLAPDQETREKIVLCCGNVHGVESVDDQMTTDEPVDESQYHMVVAGDNLSKISKEFYDSPNKYMAIFEANKPMLSHPDKIYPGQLLRIPAEA